MERLEDLDLLRRTGRIRARDEAPRNWADLTSLRHEGLAFVYPRLSTHEQRERSVWSIERQRWLEELARLDGYAAPLAREEIEALRQTPGYPGWYENGQILVDERDLGISGTLGRARRVALDHLIDLIEQERVESIYTVEISRLWRDKSLTGERSLKSRAATIGSVDVDDALRFGRLCREKQVLLVMPHMRLNLADRMHWRIYRTEAERAAEELEMMQYRLGGARTMKARQGLYPGGRGVPAGYVVDSNRESPTFQRLIPYPPHAEVVRIVFARFIASGGSAFEVVRWCRSQGIVFPPPPTELIAEMKGRSTLFRSEVGDDGWPVTHSLVRNIVTNPKYIGWWIYQREVISRHNHEPLVDEATFWEAMALAEPKQPRRRGRAANTEPLLLSNLVYCCNHDGEPRRVSSSGSAGHAWYSCHLDYRNGRADGQCLALSTYILERPITEFVTRQCSYPEHAETVLGQLASEHQQQRATQARLQEQRQALQQELVMLQANGKALLSSEHYTPSRHAELEAAIAAKRQQLRELGGPHDSGPTLTQEQIDRVRRFLTSIEAEWPSLTPALQREFLGQIALDRILMRHDNQQIWCRLLWRSGEVQEIVIQRPFVDDRVRWTEADEAVLREHFLDATVERLLDLFPNRTWIGISRKAWTMGLDRLKVPNGGAGAPKRRWEDWEMDLLRRYYAAEISKAEVQAAIPNRRWDSIRAKANQMGLSWVERQPWEPNLRWEQVPVGTFDGAQNLTPMLSEASLSRTSRRAPS